MKFQPDRAEGVNVIVRHEPQRIWVNGQSHAASLVVPWQGEVQAWGVSTREALEATHFERLLAWQPSLVIFGSGNRLVFVKPALLRPLIERGIGVETMDSVAACRTYNVLASEGRTVVAALLLESPG